MHCLCTKTKFRGSFASMAFKMGYNLRNNETNSFNNWQFFVSNVWAQQLDSRSNGWESYERFYNYESGLAHLKDFENYTIGIRANMGSHSDLAIEYIKFYNPLLTDENCNDLKPIESTTDTTDAPITESTTYPTTTDYTTTTTSEVPPVTNPSCAVYDFNDPLILDQFEECNYLSSPLLIIKSYNDSLFEPYRPTSKRFLSTNASNQMHCLCTKTKFRGSFASMAFKMGYNLRNNETNSFNNWQFFVGNVWAQQLDSRSNGWESYERFYNYESGLAHLKDFENYTIGIRANMGSHSDLAIEYIKFYNPLLTDENCNDLKSIESTTDATDAPITESTTEAPIIDTTTNVPITETTTNVTVTIEPTTTTVQTTESPLVGNRPCLKINFDQSIFDHFQACSGQYLPSFIQKSYTSPSSIQPFRNASTFYLSNKWEGLSCMESISIFSLNESSVVESAIYLNGLWPGAWIQIYVIDENSGDRQNVINVEPNTNWSVQSKKIIRKFDNARIFIMANMNSYSQLALEYLNVLNSNSTYGPCRV